MTDTRPRVSLNGKTVRLDQLAAEVKAGLTASDTEVVIAEDKSPVTVEALRAAVDAHVPDPAWGVATEDKAIDAVRAKAADVLAGKTTFTAAETQRVLAAVVLYVSR